MIWGQGQGWSLIFFLGILIGILGEEHSFFPY